MSHEDSSLTQEVAYNASKAVARSLIMLDSLPGSLSRATQLLRSLAEEHDQERPGGVFSGIDSEDEDTQGRDRSPPQTMRSYEQQWSSPM